VACTLGERCRDGECVEAACGGVVCDRREVCVVEEVFVEDAEGGGHLVERPVCRTDPCRPGDCPEGDVCFLGRCLTDRCQTAICGPNTRCETVCEERADGPDCWAVCVADWLPPPPEDLPSEEPGEVIVLTRRDTAPRPTRDTGTGVEADGDLPGPAAGSEPAGGVEGCACRTGPRPASRLPLLPLLVLWGRRAARL